MRRLIIALVASFSALLLAATVAPAATAQDTTIVSTDRSAANGSERAAKPAHKIKGLRAGETGKPNKFYVKGKVTTNHFVKVKLQKSNSKKSGPYRTVAQQKVRKRDGFFRITFSGKIGNHFRIVVPGTSKYRTTKRYIGKIVPQA